MLKTGKSGLKPCVRFAPGHKVGGYGTPALCWKKAQARQQVRLDYIEIPHCLFKYYDLLDRWQPDSGKGIRRHSCIK